MSMLAAFLAAMGGIRVTISDQSVSDIGFGPRTATYTLTNTGLVQNHVPTTLENWITPTSAAGGAYEARATLNSGALGSGTTGSWLALNTSRSWSVSVPSTGTADANLTIEIRLASSGVILDSAFISLNAESF